MLIGLRRLILTNQFSSRSQEAHNSASSSRRLSLGTVGTKLGVLTVQTGWAGSKITCHSAFKGLEGCVATHFPYPLAWSVCVSARASFRAELPRLTAGQAGPRYGVRVESVSAAVFWLCDSRKMP